MRCVEKQSAYKMGWLLVMFDLPVLTKKQRKMASGFRMDLLDDGFFMVQFSVYARAGVSQERMEKHTNRLKEITPHAGNVRVLFLTDKQWAKGLTITGPDYDQGRRAKNLEMPKQIEFW